MIMLNPDIYVTWQFRQIYVWRWPLTRHLCSEMCIFLSTIVDGHQCRDEIIKTTEGCHSTQDVLLACHDVEVRTGNIRLRYIKGVGVPK